jgi:hypothetical protein
MTSNLNVIPEVFVLWHPRCALGETLARQVHRWLRPTNGVGPEVFYRSLPAPDADDEGLPPPLPQEQRKGAPGSSGKSMNNLQIVLPLIDENMVADPAWRNWLVRLADPTTKAFRRLLPVALDATAYNMPGPMRELNYLRPAGLGPAPWPGEEPSLDVVQRSLCKQLTEAMCRILLPRSRAMGDTQQLGATDDAAPKVSIFLSHAKSDGTGPATRLRDYIYGQTQLTAFYDENDIAFGSAFARVLESGLKDTGTAAMVAVRTASYASRPWCRRELALFRRPRRVADSPNGSERWQLYPTLIVEAMDKATSSAGISDFGNSSVIRWSDGVEGLEETIVTSVIRDAMLAAYHAAVGATIPKRSPKATKQVIINWLPDPNTLLHIPAVRSGRAADVIHPGRGLPGLELDTLLEYFPSITFHSFEEVLS